MPSKDLRQLVARLEKEGFTVETGRGSPVLIAPNGARSHFDNTKALRGWADRQLRTSARTERQDHGGATVANRDNSKRSRVADGVLSHWERLPAAAKEAVVKEMLHRLGRDGNDDAAEALYRMEGGR